MGVVSVEKWMLHFNCPEGAAFTGRPRPGQRVESFNVTSTLYRSKSVKVKVLILLVSGLSGEAGLGRIFRYFRCGYIPDRS
jgi:hypothetical protein